MTVKILEDHLKRTVTFHFPPSRIISLCPSITETLFALQLSNRIVGRTRYCIHPAGKIKQAAIVGGTKQIIEKVIAQLKPDLIIAEKEENPKEMIDLLAARYPIFVTNVENYKDSLKMIDDLGVICDREEEARKIAKGIMEQFQNFQPADEFIKVAYVIWNKPYMVAGQSTFIDSILEHCGFRNVFNNRPERYPVVTMEDLLGSDPDFILLSSEPYPFKEIHRDEFARQIPRAKPILVDGEFFSWYGVRMVEAVSYLNKLISSLKRQMNM
jgi:iron complex transport system substrate-binding protein